MQIKFKKPINIGNKLGVSSLKQIGDDLEWQITYLGVHKHILDDEEHFKICRYLRQQKGVLYCLIGNEIKTFEIDLNILNVNAILDLYDLAGIIYFLSEKMTFSDKKKPQFVLISHFENENISIEVNETGDIYHIQ